METTLFPKTSILGELNLEQDKKNESERGTESRNVQQHTKACDKLSLF